MPAPIKINLSKDEIKQLKKIISSSISPVRLIKRSKAILMAANDMPSYQIAEQLKVSKDTVGRWRKRFAEQGLGGISKDRPRGGNHGGKDSASQQRLRALIVKKATTEKPAGQTHWSTRTMAAAVGTTHSLILPQFLGHLIKSV